MKQYKKQGISLHKKLYFQSSIPYNRKRLAFKAIQENLYNKLL